MNFKNIVIGLGLAGGISVAQGQELPRTNSPGTNSLVLSTQGRIMAGLAQPNDKELRVMADGFKNWFPNAQMYDGGHQAGWTHDASTGVLKFVVPTDKVRTEGRKNQ